MLLVWCVIVARKVSKVCNNGNKALTGAGKIYLTQVISTSYLWHVYGFRSVLSTSNRLDIEYEEHL